MVKGFINGLMEELIKEIGIRIRCMGRVSILGKTEGCTRENIKMIKKMVKVHLTGQQAKVIMDRGKMVFNMVSDTIPIRKV